MTEHPSHFELDLALAGAPSQAFADHVAACDACRARRDELAAEQAEFERSDQPALAARAIAKRLQTEGQTPAERTRWPERRAWIAGAGAAVALAAGLLLVLRPRDPEPGVRAKGDLVVETYVKRGDAEPFLLGPATRLRPGDAVQLAYHGAATGHATVFHVDAACGVHLETTEPAGSDGLFPMSWRLDALGGDRLYVAIGEVDEAAFSRALHAVPGGCDPTAAPALADRGWIARGVALRLEAP